MERKEEKMKKSGVEKKRGREEKEYGECSTASYFTI